MLERLLEPLGVELAIGANTIWSTPSQEFIHVQIKETFEFA